MAYIQFHQSLVTHRKLYALAGELNLPRPHAAGHLAFLWQWALDNCPDGDLSHTKPAVIGMAAEWSGDPQVFIDACLAAGFMAHGDGSLRLHDWDDYAGRLIRSRELNRDRARTSRARPAHGTRDDGVTYAHGTRDDGVTYAHGTRDDGVTYAHGTRDDGVTYAHGTRDDGVTCAQRAGLEKSREEKSREEKSREAAAARAPTREEDPDLARAYRAYENLAGLAPVTVSGAIIDALDAGVPADWIEEACKEAALNGARTWNYVKAIIERWQRDGFKAPRKEATNGRRTNRGAATAGDDSERYPAAEGWIA